MNNMNPFSFLDGQIAGITALICGVWVIYDVYANQPSMSSGKKILWIIFALFFSIITAIVYYFAVKRKV